MFKQALLAGVNEHHAGGKQQCAELQQQQHAQRLFEEPVEPCVRNLEAKLVIQRLRRRGDEALRLPQQADEPAFIDGPPHLALHARAVHFENEIDQRFRRDEQQHHAQPPGQPKVRHAEIHLHRRDAGGDKKAEIRAQQEVARPGPQQARAFQAGKAGGDLAQHEQQQREQAEAATSKTVG